MSRATRAARRGYRRSPGRVDNRPPTERHGGAGSNLIERLFAGKPMTRGLAIAAFIVADPRVALVEEIPPRIRRRSRPVAKSRLGKTDL